MAVKKKLFEDKIILSVSWMTLTQNGRIFILKRRRRKINEIKKRISRMKDISIIYDST